MATELQVRVAAVCVARTDPLMGTLLIAQPGTVTATAAVVNVVLLVASQPTAGPEASFGTTYQLYRVLAVKPVAA